MNPTPTPFGAEYLETVPFVAFGGCPLTDKIRCIDLSTGEVTKVPQDPPLP